MANSSTADDVYRSVHGPLQYSEADELVGFAFDKTAREADQSGNMRTRIRRLAQEHADLSHSLPLNPSSSAWMVAHAARMDQLRFIISGPEDTPYSGGLWLFDTFFPFDYPKSPPKVKLLTTGQGTLRANPNLYNCGKVCLSLLGTWGGAEGETWDANTSTLLQVIVSIQSLIFVPDPYFNEPGFEQQMGTAHGRAQSDQYNHTIREGTLNFAMIDMLRNPPKGFEKVVRAHFLQRREFILEQSCRWRDEAQRNARAAEADRLGNLVSTLEGLLSGLTER